MLSKSTTCYSRWEVAKVIDKDSNKKKEKKNTLLRSHLDQKEGATSHQLG